MKTTIENLVPFNVRAVFSFMGIAEEEIDSAKQRHDADTMHACFGLMQPPPGMTALTPALYRHHCREVLDRVAAGKSIDGLTDAEVVMVLHAGSLRAPLNQDHSKLYADLCQRCVGMTVDSDARETYPGAVAELLATYKRKKSPRSIPSLGVGAPKTCKRSGKRRS